MKKHLYTIAFVSLFGVMAKAQHTEPAAQPAKAKQEQKVNPDGTISPAQSATPAQEIAPASNNQAAPASSGKTGPTRMAITEKGVPASKSAPESKPKATEKKAEPAKTEKH